MKLDGILIKSFYTAMCICLAIQSSFSQTKELAFTSDLDAAFIVAKETNKNVLVNFFVPENYGSREMDKTVYSHEEVNKIILDDFVYVKLVYDYRIKNLVRKYKVFDAPTSLFLDSEGVELHRVIGYEDADKFLETLSFALNNKTPLGKYYQENFDQNKTNITFIKEYINYASEIRDYKLRDDLTKQFAKLIPHSSKDQWLTFVKENVYKEDSKLFDILVDNKEEFSKMYGAKEINNTVLKILILSGFDRSTKKLTQNILKKLKKYNIQMTGEELLPTLANFAFDSRYPCEMSDSRTELGIRILKDYSDKVDKSILRTIISDVSVGREEKSVLLLADEACNKLLIESPTAYLHDLKSIILYKLGQVDESYKQIEIAKLLSENTHKIYYSSLELMKETGRIK